PSQLLAFFVSETIWLAERAIFSLSVASNTGNTCQSSPAVDKSPPFRAMSRKRYSPGNFTPSSRSAAAICASVVGNATIMTGPSEVPRPPGRRDEGNDRVRRFGGSGWAALLGATARSNQGDTNGEQQAKRRIENGVKPRKLATAHALEYPYVSELSD